MENNELQALVGKLIELPEGKKIYEEFEATLKAEGMLEKIDFSNVPNHVNIGEQFKGLYFDPTCEYSIPYTYGMIGIIYNTDVVDEEDTEDESWDLMWNEKYSRKILQFNFVCLETFLQIALIGQVIMLQWH